MKFQKSSEMIGGAWVKKADVEDGAIAVIVSETEWVEGEYQGKAQKRAVAKVRIGQNDPQNIALNQATRDGLIDAFGPESKDWQGKNLTVVKEKSRFGGKVGYAVYLVPEGYEKVDDDEGYAKIVKIGEKAEPVPVVDDIVELG